MGHHVPGKRKSAHVTRNGFSAHIREVFFVLEWYWYVFRRRRDGIMKTK